LASRPTTSKQTSRNPAKEGHKDPGTGASPSALHGTEGFKPPEVCRIVGITYRQLDHWANTGLVTPSVSGDVVGSGSRRRYSYQDLLRLRVIKRLREAGLSLQQIRRAVGCLRNLNEDLATANLVMVGRKAVIAQTDDYLFDLLRGGQGVLINVLPLAGVVEEVDAAIEKVHPIAG